jgi:hypothetical protein
VQTGETVTTRTERGRDTINRTNLEDDKPDGLRRLTSNVVKRQHTTDEAVTFLRPPGLRRLTNDVVQRQHTTDEAVTFLRPIQKNRPTFQSIKKKPETRKPNRRCTTTRYVPDPPGAPNAADDRWRPPRIHAKGTLERSNPATI